MNQPQTSSKLSPNDPCHCGSGQKYKRCHKSLDAVESRKANALSPDRVQPGVVSPLRTVPQEIARPEYALSGRPARSSGSEIKTPEQIVRMRKACKAAAEILQELSKEVRPGITTDEIDALAHQAYIARGGYPSTLNYHGFPKSLCTSVNEVVCHGIPDSRALLDGDIVNLDITIFLDGMHGDTSATFGVGTISEESKKLMQVTYDCMMRGIEAVKPGQPINAIGKAIEEHATKHGYGIVRSYCGHGIGERFHTSLQIPHYFDPEADTIIEPGMTFTVEPMITLGSWQCRTWHDGWTVVTADLKRTAQYEHTLLVTDQGAEILTVP